MLSWGATTMGLGGAHNYAQVTGLRFLLGVMEAGLFPGFVYYLTFWYRNSERSMRIALILASATLAGAFGGAIAFGVGAVPDFENPRVAFKNPQESEEEMDIFA